MLNRRKFLQFTGLTAGGLVAAAGPSEASEKKEADPNAYGCLVDVTLCIGCRSCEKACNEVNDLPQPEKPFDDLSVLDKNRRMDIESYTVVNSYKSKNPRNESVNVKIQCMHCIDPGCVSACLVGAMIKTPEGPVTWDNLACLGCRYCMIACPFGVPAYEYYKGIEPRVMKCTFCNPRIQEGQIPGCAEACPMEAIKFGPRAKLLEVARERIKKNPERYIDRIYGEREVGGTSWLYLAPQSFESLDFLDLPETSGARVSEGIQHGVFKYFAAPIALYTGLGVLMGLTKAKHEPEPEADETAEEAEGEQSETKEEKGQ
jgi:formate dehydrogenase iron-sulfur subunit